MDSQQSNDEKWNSLFSKPSGNPYASLSTIEEVDDGPRAEPTEAQKRAYVKNSQNPYAQAELLGDAAAMANSATVDAITISKSDDLSNLLSLDTKSQQTLPFDNSLESDELTERWVSNILSNYLPRSLRPRDRKIVKDVVSEFVIQANTLLPAQKKFLKRKLLSMEPEGGRRLEAARTTANTIKDILRRLLDEARGQQ
jgi:hypothetical protein